MTIEIAWYEVTGVSDTWEGVAPSPHNTDDKWIWFIYPHEKRRQGHACVMMETPFSGTRVYDDVTEAKASARLQLERWVR